MTAQLPTVWVVELPAIPSRPRPPPAIVGRASEAYSRGVGRGSAEGCPGPRGRGRRRGQKCSAPTIGVSGVLLTLGRCHWARPLSFRPEGEALRLGRVRRHAVRVYRVAAVYAAACSLAVGAGVVAARTAGSMDGGPGPDPDAAGVDMGLFEEQSSGSTAASAAPGSPRPGPSRSSASQAGAEGPEVEAAGSGERGGSGARDTSRAGAAAPGADPGAVAPAGAEHGGGVSEQGRGSPVPPAYSAPDPAPLPQAPAAPAFPEFPDLPIPTLTLRQIPVEPPPQPEPLRPLRFG